MAKKKTAKKATASQTTELKIKPIEKGYVRVRLVGVTPVITHAWSQKAKTMMLEKKQGKKSKDRSACVPKDEVEAASYKTAKGKYGVPLMAIKKSIIGAAHKDLGIEKTLVKKALFLIDADCSGVAELDYGKREGCEDHVRVGQGSADLRYRPYYYDWSTTIVFQLDRELLQLEDLLALIDRAGFGVGICEWRPEKGGEFGRFEVDYTSVVSGPTLCSVK